jgi:hypothetical protein
LSAHLQKEEKAREEELAAMQKKQEQDALKKAVFTLPPDPQLVKYIEEVTEKILPLPTTTSQVTALAG